MQNSFFSTQLYSYSSFVGSNIVQSLAEDFCSKERFCTKQDTALALAGVKREEDGSKEVKRGKALSRAGGWSQEEA